ncbi:MAG TPA: DUF5666 domain-containing protein [Terracidiphilus sp.]|nr:DUF5666 domain-containing protein [Terracidiphilus sp.]
MGSHGRFAGMVFRPGCRVAVSAFALSTLTLFTSGCGGGSTSSNSGSATGPVAGESTTVAIQLSSTANDEFVHFNMTIDQISLTNQEGKTTTIFSTPTGVDFIPANGNSIPFATVSVPQDVYTSAAISVSNPSFSYISMDPQGGIYISTDAYGYTPTPPVVNLTGPITISGSAMALKVDLQASQSGSYSGAPPNQTAYTINPTFQLSSFAIPAKPTSPQNGLSIGLAGQVTSIDNAGTTLTVALAGHPLAGSQSLQVALDPSTVIQGVPLASSLVPGTLIDFDLALQPDASYAATRIDVPDATATNLNTGQIMEIDPSYNYVMSDSTQQEGSILSDQPVGMGYPYEFGASTSFFTSARFQNLSSLPFNAVFNGSTLAPGQMVSVASTSISFTGGTWTEPTSITLVAQTIDALVTSVTNAGGSGYTVYTVQLAPYDLIVQMNSAAGAAVNSRLANASTVNVYVNSATTVLNSTPLAAGGVFRFTGLLFNDGGVLRMVCDRVDDQVPQ